MEENSEKYLALEKWNELKFSLHQRQALVQIKEDEVWWCSIGENVGTEINGKGEKYSRPVLVYRKLGKFQFLGIPLSTKEHAGTWQAKFRFKNRDQFAALNQIRIINIARLQERMGTLDKADIKKIAAGFNALYYK